MQIEREKFARKERKVMKPKKAEKIGVKQVKLIHTAKTKVGMSEEAYRDMLASFGFSTSKDLLASQFDAVMDRFEAGGFVRTRHHKSAAASGMDKEPPAEKKPLLSKIGALLTELEKPWSYADGIARQMFRVQKIRWCTCEQLLKVVAALAMHLRRKEEKNED